MQSGKLTTALFALAAGAGIVYLLTYNKTSPSIQIPSSEEQSAVIEQAPRTLLYEIDVTDLEVTRRKIKNGQFFTDILGAMNMDQHYLNVLAMKFKDVFDVRRLKAGRPYSVISRNDDKPSYFVYELNTVDYVVFDFLRDSVYTASKAVRFERKSATGIIKSSLYETFAENDLHPDLGMQLADVFAWVIDFYRLQKEDKFKVIYLERFVDDKPAGVEKVLGAEFNHSGSDFYAFYFQPDSSMDGDYFDESSNSLRKAFLKAPLKFGRISSRYSHSRLHPVLKKRRPHLGTDYAAPQGTPILSVGDGVVIEASYTKNNGNYVKVRHNSTYSTQYLHMSGFARGIKAGTKVSQGQVIGYVGSTGLATGPHVCFRFWKNGAQVDPLKITIPPSKPVEANYLDRYHSVAQTLKNELDQLKFQ